MKCLKDKEYKKIQTIELNIFKIYIKRKYFEIFEQIKFEDEQSIKYFLFQFQFHTITKSGFVGLTTFHK